MRFREIANPADQLALWKLISDKMWAAFEEPVPKRPNTLLPLQRTAQGRAASPANRGAKPVPKVPRKSSVKAKPKTAKPRRAPMAPAPKPVPKSVAIPKPQQLSPPMPQNSRLSSSNNWPSNCERRSPSHLRRKESTPSHQPPPKSCPPPRHP